MMAKDEVSHKYTRWGTWQGWLVIIAFFGIMALIVSWNDLPFNRLTSIEAITTSKPKDVVDKRVELKLVQIPSDSHVRYDSANDDYTFLVHDGIGNSILVTASAEPKRLVFEPLPFRVPHINFEPKPGDYVIIKGTIGFAKVDLRFDNMLNLYIAAYEVKRVPIS